MSDVGFHLDVVSSDGAIFSGQVYSIIVPTQQGDVGIYARHSPLLAICRQGQLAMTLADNRQDFLYISGGVLEVHPLGVTLLADSVVRGADIDEAAVIKAREAAIKTIEQRGDSRDCAEAYAELLKAAALLQTLKNCRHQRR